MNSVRFMASSFSNLVDNFSKKNLGIKYKYGHDNKEVTFVKPKTRILSAVVNTQTLKMI